MVCVCVPLLWFPTMSFYGGDVIGLMPQLQTWWTQVIPFLVASSPLTCPAFETLPLAELLPV